MNHRAMPEEIMSYKCEIQLFKLYNDKEHSHEWISLNFYQIFNTHQTTFAIMKTNSTKVGLNQILNRLSVINGLIPFSWLNWII